MASSSATSRFAGIVRNYTQEDVDKLKGTLKIDHTLAKRGAQRFWEMLNNELYIPALGAFTGNQAVQMVQAGLKAIYLSGWQVAADANSSLATYPDLSLYPVDSVPKVVERINNALQRADQIAHMNGDDSIDWYASIVADGEAGFGGNLNTFELTKALIKAGASAIHLEDQLASAKKCGHLGGKVLCSTGEFIQKLQAARLAADVMDVPTVLIARTDALGADLLTTDIDDRDKAFCTGERTGEGFFKVKPGIEQAIARGLAYAPYADLLWFETSQPDIDEAKLFAERIHEHFPGKLLAYNCSPSFNWKKMLKDDEIASFQKRLATMGYKFQFITLASFHSMNFSTFVLARDYATRGMSAYADLQQGEFMSETFGYKAAKHQSFVGTNYFDEIAKTINAQSSTTAMKGSTEHEQFH